MSLRKKSNRTQTILIAILLAILVIGFFASLTTDGSSDPTAGSSTDVTVEAPAETEPANPTPAIIGGVAAMAVYYLGSVAISALKKGKKDDKKKEK